MHNNTPQNRFFPVGILQQSAMTSNATVAELQLELSLSELIRHWSESLSFTLTVASFSAISEVKH